MKRRRFVRAVLPTMLVLASCLVARSQSPGAGNAGAQASYVNDPAFQSAVEQARQLDEPSKGRFSHWKEANELSGDECVECLHHVVEGAFAAHAWKDAAAAAEQLDTLPADKNEKFYAEASAGKALLHDDHESSYPPPAQLQKAEGYFRLALSRVRSPVILRLDGEVLASLGQYEQAKAQFELFLSVTKDTYPRRDEVQAYVADPRLGARYLSAIGTGDRTAPGSTAPTQTTSSSATTEPAYKSDAKFQKAFAAAQERVAVDEKLARWKKANKLANGECVECLRAIVTLQMNMSQWKDAVTTCNGMEAVSTEKKDKFFAAAERGEALMHSDDGQLKPEQARLAEASFHTALEISPRTKNLLFKEGRALALLGRDEDAKAMFQRYLSQAGEADPYRMRAEHFVEEPHLAALPMAPPFTVTTSEGEQISLDEQVGKVVLLDFWATWCGPCKQTMPEIHSIAKKFAGQPLVVVSISSDSNDIAWKDFIAKNDMFWAQYRDANHALSSAYGVSAIPRFFTIDADGVLQSVKVGSGADVEGDLKKLIRKASDAEKKKALHSEKQAAE